MKSTKHKKLVIAGGSGFLGQTLIELLASAFNETVVLSRKFHENSTKITAR